MPVAERKTACNLLEGIPVNRKRKRRLSALLEELLRQHLNQVAMAFSSIWEILLMNPDLGRTAPRFDEVGLVFCH